MPSDSGEMLRKATVMADRLAAGRYARPIFFLRDQPSELTAILLRIGEQLSARGYSIVIVDDPRDASCRIVGQLGEAISS